MNKTLLSFILIFAIVFETMIADYYLKLASNQEKPFATRHFFIAFIAYSLTIVPWIYIMKYLKLATIAVVYSITTVILLTLLGVFVFNETLNHYEVAGVIMAITSIILLSRFA